MSTHTIMRWVDPAHVSFLGSADKLHEPSPQIGGVTILTGQASTGPRGFWQLSLSDISRDQLSAIENISVVATPLQPGQPDIPPRPVFLVAKVSGLTIAVWSFTTEGVWAPSVDFAWQCVLQDRRGG